MTSKSYPIQNILTVVRVDAHGNGENGKEVLTSIIEGNGGLSTFLPDSFSPQRLSAAGSKKRRRLCLRTGSSANSLEAGKLVTEQMLCGMVLNFISNFAFAKICSCQKRQHIRVVHLLKLNTIPGSPGEGHRPPGRLSPSSPQQGGNTGGPKRLGLPGSLEAPPHPTLSWVCHSDGLSWMDESPAGSVRLCGAPI